MSKPEPIKTFTHNECKVEIYIDPDPMSPAEWDGLGTIVHWHRRDHLFGQAGDRDHVLPADIVVKLPIWIYQHGGISVWAGGSAPADPWDSGQVGWIYMTREQVSENWPDWKLITPKRKKLIEKVLEARVKSWDDYYLGRVYGYEVTAPDGSQDSCWGFYGDDGYVEQAARDAAAHLNPQLPLPGVLA